jgi:hypothetical protein
MGWVLAGLARLAYDAGQFAQAQSTANEALDVRRSIGDRRGVLETLVLTADIALGLGDVATARAALKDLYANAWAPELATETASALSATARCLLASGAARAAAQVFGFRESFVSASESRLRWSGDTQIDELEEALRAALGTAAFEAERSSGYLRDPDAVVGQVRGALA